MKDHSVDHTINLEHEHEHEHEQEQQQDSLHRILVPDVRDLPLTPPSAIESNFVSYFAPGTT